MAASTRLEPEEWHDGDGTEDGDALLNGCGPAPLPLGRAHRTFTPRRWLAAPLLVTLLLVGHYVWPECFLCRIQRRGQPRIHVDGAVELEELSADQNACGTPETGVELRSTIPAFESTFVATAQACRHKCQESLICSVWSWAHGSSRGGVCSLEELSRDEHPKRITAENVVSGRCRHAVMAAHSKVPAEPDSVLPVVQGAASGEDSANCGKPEKDIEYLTNQILYRLTPITSASACGKLCAADPLCIAWAWGGPPTRDGQWVVGETQVCVVKGAAPGEEPRRVAKQGMISGRSCAFSGEHGHGENRTDCSSAEDGFEYWTSTALYTAQPVQEAAACSAQCARDPQCDAWTWGKRSATSALARLCFLKALQHGEEPWKKEMPGVVSGLSCGAVSAGIKVKARPTHTITTTTRSTSTSTTISTTIFYACNPSACSQGLTCNDNPGVCCEPGDWACCGSVSSNLYCPSNSGNAVMCESGQCVPSIADCSAHGGVRYSSTPCQTEARLDNVVAGIEPTSLFCFALMMPFGYEPSLISWQYRRRIGIFACDEVAVYSNVSWEIAPGFHASVVRGSLQCKIGGDWNTALNTPIFLRVWGKVISQERFYRYSWTVKVDPDCVFLPDRLRAALGRHSETPTGTFINNCHYGLHGPFEVFSRNAVRTFAQGWGRCVAHFTKKCHGQCPWGEDMYMDQCLDWILKVRRDDDFDMLSEDHCDPAPDWKTCKNVSKIAFHPFKTVEGYKNCLQHAGALDHRDRQPGSLTVAAGF